MLSTPCCGSELCHGTSTDTSRDVTPKLLPALGAHTATAQPKMGQNQLKSRTHPTHSSPKPRRNATSSTSDGRLGQPSRSPVAAQTPAPLAAELSLQTYQPTTSLKVTESPDIQPPTNPAHNYGFKVQKSPARLTRQQRGHGAKPALWLAHQKHDGHSLAPALDSNLRFFFNFFYFTLPPSLDVTHPQARLQPAARCS